MAYASIAGFNPVAGLFSSVVPAIAGSLAARTVLMVTTLTSAASLTAQSVLGDAGLDPRDSGNVAVLGLLSGIVIMLMGALRLDVVLSFVSNAVMVGFSTGIALQIVVGVPKDATAYQPQGYDELTQLGWLAHAGSSQPAATLTVAATVAVWALAHAVKRLQAAALLVAMVSASAGATTDIAATGGEWVARDLTVDLSAREDSRVPGGWVGDARVPFTAAGERRIWDFDLSSKYVSIDFYRHRDEFAAAALPGRFVQAITGDAVRTGEFIIMLAPEARGRGLAACATRLTLDYAFHISNMRSSSRSLAPTSRRSALTSARASGTPEPCASPDSREYKGVCVRSLWRAAAHRAHFASAIRC